MQTLVKNTSAAVGLALLTGLGYLAACKQDTPEAAPQLARAQQTVSAQGGSVATPDQAVRVTLPAGAVNASTTVAIEQTTQVAPKGLGSVYKLTPEGTTFAQPVTITLRYTDAQAQKTNPALMAVAYKKANGEWQTVPTTKIDRQNKTISGRTTHFSEWTLLEVEEGVTFATSDLEVKNRYVNFDYYERLPPNPPAVLFLRSAERPDSSRDFVYIGDIGLHVNVGLTVDPGLIIFEASGRKYQPYKDPGQVLGYEYDYGNKTRDDFRRGGEFNLIELPEKVGEYSVGFFNIPVHYQPDSTREMFRKVDMVQGEFRAKRTK